MENNFITICTPTYNRGNLLSRPFESLCKQTKKNFIWLIIDDGSDDNTKKIVENFAKISNFKIVYKYKENGGRHTALNYSYEFIDTEWVLNLDSDDALVEDAVEKILKIINKLKNNYKDEYNEIWQISGRSVDPKTNKIIGNLYPKNINEVSRKKQDKLRAKIDGEKSCCRKVDILRKFPFPIYKDTNFVTENEIWYKIDLHYKSYCTNEIFRYYYYTENSLTNMKYDKRKHRTFYHFSIFCLNELTSQLFYKREVFKSIFNVPRRALKTGLNYKSVMKDIKKWYIKAIVTLIGYPIAYIYIKIKDNG